MTAPSWAWRRLMIIGCAVALGLAGCVTEEPADPPRTTSEGPAPDAPKDRNERAVLAALARIDMCAVLESAAAGTLRARSPSTCQASSPGGGGVGLRVARLPTAKRLELPSRTLGGAKAYVFDAGEACTVSLPVSFELALDIDARDMPATEPCVVAEAAATAVATTLADPATVRADTRWEACGALGSVPGSDAGPPESMDLCFDRNTKATLELNYTKPGTYYHDGWRRETVGGVEIWTHEDPDPENPNCRVEWSQGPAPSHHIDDADQLVASLRAVDCGRIRPLVEPLITTLRQPPPQTEPQRPLLYGPNEPDSPATTSRPSSPPQTK